MTDVVRSGPFAGASIDDLRELVELTDDPDDLDEIIRAIEIELRWQPFPYQIAPGSIEWFVWLFLAGRFTGKTDTMAHWMDDHANGPACDPRLPGGHRMSILAPTLGDAAESCVNGPSGLRAHNPDVHMVTRAGGTVVVWPNGAEAMLFGGWTEGDVERFRAKGNRCACWIEEGAAIPQLEAAFAQIPFSHRLGRNPQVVISTTPKPRPLLNRLVAHARVWRDDGTTPINRHERVVVTRASSRMNPTIERDVVEGLYAEFGNSRLGRQELEGELLDDYEGALWSRERLDDLRVEPGMMPTLLRRYVGVDPSTWGLKENDRHALAGTIGRGIETGIVVSGVDQRRDAYTLADYSRRATPAEWANVTLDAYKTWSCAGIVFETNAGGAMGPTIIQATDKARRLEHPSEDRPPIRFYRDPKSPKRIGVIAADGKRARAEPVAALADGPIGTPGRHHMVGVHAYLEDQLCGWDPNESWSPDRLDALVWSITALAPWRTVAPASIGSQPRGSVAR